MERKSRNVNMVILETFLELEKCKPIRLELEIISEAIVSFQNENVKTRVISKAKALLNKIKPKLHNIATSLGTGDYIYKSISNIVVESLLEALNIYIEVAKDMSSMDSDGITPALHSYSKSLIKESIEIAFRLEKLEMSSELRNDYDSYLITWKELAKSKGIKIIHPIERIENKIKALNKKRLSVSEEIFNGKALQQANLTLQEIIKWKLFRNPKRKALEIDRQNKVIDSINIERDNVQVIDKQIEAQKRKLLIMTSDALLAKSNP